MGKGASSSSVEKYFYTCPKCRSLYYKAIPFAFYSFDVRECPGCNHPFPSEQDIEFSEASRVHKSVMQARAFTNPRHTPEKLETLYEKLLKLLPVLSKAIDDIMLVDTPEGKDIWVVCMGRDDHEKGDVETPLQYILGKAIDYDLSFSLSTTYEGAMKEEGLKILRQSKKK
ncbi:MAG: hypothetical protein E4G94_05905 [ANME-2 cluster archaeon]|nr:MAG: hypothetical protein E4G94_05905 [ANME-2 cluster archaeon]